jgi:transcriptional regulator with XRE-family HTH domain
MQFGERVRELREERHISQRELAAMTGVDFTYISKIETGKNAPPSMKAIHSIAIALSADEHDLIELAGKTTIQVYRNLAQRAYALLHVMSQTGDRVVDHSEVEKWLVDAKRVISEY